MTKKVKSNIIITKCLSVYKDNTKSNHRHLLIMMYNDLP